MKAIGRALDGASRQQTAVNSQDKRTSKDSTTMGTGRKFGWRSILGIIFIVGASNSMRNPPAQHDLPSIVGYLIAIFVFVFIGAWLLISDLAKRPRRALFILSLGLLLLAGAGAAIASAIYNVQRSAESHEKFGNALRAFTNDARHYVEGGGSGTPPTMKPTGDATYDLAGRFLNDFYQEFLGVIVAMNKELDGLEEKDVFAASILTNKASLETEARKRIDSERIIEKYRNDVPGAIDAFRQKAASYNISNQQKKAVLGAFDDLRPKVSHQFETMFDLRKRKEKAELDFLYLMAGNEYELKNGKISFHSEMARQKYHDLTESIEDTAKDIAAFQKRQLEVLNAGIQKLSQ